MFKRAWLAGLAGVFAISAGVSVAKAESYSLAIIEGSCGGISANCGSNSPNFPLVGFVGLTGTWTSTLSGGGLNFNLTNELNNTIGGFLSTGTGTFTNVVSQNGGSLNDLLSQGKASGRRPCSSSRGVCFGQCGQYHPRRWHWPCA